MQILNSIIMDGPMDGRTNGGTDAPTDKAFYKVACPQVKIEDPLWLSSSGSRLAEFNPKTTFTIQENTLFILHTNFYHDYVK